MMVKFSLSLYSASHQNRIVGRETPHRSRNESFAAMYGTCPVYPLITASSAFLVGGITQVFQLIVAHESARKPKK
jgi:hypothetical protein